MNCNSSPCSEKRGITGRTGHVAFKAIVRTYLRHYRPSAEAELDWFRQQPTIESAIELAALAVNRKGKRYSHQRRLRKVVLEGARDTILKNSNRIAKAENFERLFSTIAALLEPIHGIGELYIYDTCLRLGAKLGHSPKGVYLHAGTRAGACALGFGAHAKVLNISELPPELRQLEPYEIEDLLCIFKDDLVKARKKIVKLDLVAWRNWCH